MHQRAGRRDHQASPLAQRDRPGLANCVDGQCRHARQRLCVGIDLEAHRADHLYAELRLQRLRGPLERVDRIGDEDLVPTRRVTYFEILVDERFVIFRHLIGIHDDVRQPAQVPGGTCLLSQLRDPVGRRFVVARIEFSEHFELDDA